MKKLTKEEDKILMEDRACFQMCQKIKYLEILGVFLPISDSIIQIHIHMCICSHILFIE